MSFSFNIFSHPDKYLEDHLLNVANLSKESLQNSKFENNDFLSEISFIIGISHDFAKATSFFQDLLFESKKSKKAHHGFLSAVFTYYNLNNFLKKKDFDKNSFNESIHINSISILGYLVVIRHHGNLKSVKTSSGKIDEIETLKETFDELKPQVEDFKKQISYFSQNNGNLDSKNIISLSNFYKQFDIDILDFLNNYSNFKKAIRKDLRNLLKSKDILNYLNLNLLYSVLLDGDKLDASGTNVFERKKISPGLVDKFKFENFTNNEGINKIREKSYLDAVDKIDTLNINKNKIFSLELPTGCGKTLTGFSFALKLRDKIKKEENFTPKIIYSLPFLSIIDQNESVIREILDYFGLTGSDYLLKHSHMSDMNYVPSQNLDEELSENKSQLLTEGWYSEIIITTFIQLFYTLISNKNKSIRKFHNITNSIILLDEIQSIPYKFWPIINKILIEVSNKFNVWIILMTATQPLIFKENDEIIPLIDKKMEYFKAFNRVKFKFNLENKDFEEFKAAEDIFNSFFK
jgi:CRISPR-associated endonuclease/helicase Cas3